MSTFLRFDTSAGLQAFIRDHALAWSAWREIPIWRDHAAGTFTLKSPELQLCSTPIGGQRLEAPPSGSQVVENTLGELWRSARPTPRDRLGADAPCSWLFVFAGLDTNSCDQFIELAPAGLEVLILQESTTDGKRYRACMLRGEAARMLAQSPPVGCEAFECDETPGGGLAALPCGWRVPRMLDELWPEGRDRIVLYRRTPDGVFSVQEMREAERYPLANILAAWPTAAKCAEGLAAPTDRLRPSQWRVVRRESIGPKGLRDLDSGETIPTVFRVKTVDAGARAGSLAAAQGHHLGNSLLQVLDECEAGLLPSINYAAVDLSEYERWHFLYAKAADSRLLDAWSMLDRFDYVPELAEHDLKVFVSASSRLIPPIPALLDSSVSRKSVLARIRKLLGSPPKGSIVLIEDLEPEGATSQDVWENRSANPRIVHLDLATSLPLSDLIPRLVQGWNNAEPMRAMAELAEPAYIAELRQGHESRLRSIAAEEEEVLRAAATEAHQSLAEWAARAKVAIEQASTPVREAQCVCDELGNALTSGVASCEQACAQLARLCAALTVPRRSWVTDQLRQNATAVSQAAEIGEEATKLRVEAERMRAELESQTATLTRAVAALNAIAPQLGDGADAAAATLRAATAAREQVEALAASAMRQVQTQFQEVARERERAAARQQDVRLRQTECNNERERVASMEADNQRLDAANRALEAENRQRTATAQARRLELEGLRDVELPRLERERRHAEEQLAALDPRAVQAQHDEACKALNDVRDRIDAVDAKSASIGALRGEIDKESARLEARRAEHARESEEFRRARVALDEAIRALEAGITEFAQRQESHGDPAWIRAQVARANKVLVQLRSSKPRTIWNRLGFGRSDA